MSSALLPMRPAAEITRRMEPKNAAVCFLGDSLKRLRDFPRGARHDAGYQPDKVQRGDQPDDFKPMPAIGQGVEEIRVSDSTGGYRVIYVARRAIFKSRGDASWNCWGGRT